MGGEILYIEKIKTINENHYIIKGIDGNFDILGAESLGNRPKELEIEIEIKEDKLSIKNLWGSEVNNLIKLEKDSESKIFNKLNLLIKNYSLSSNQNTIFFTPAVPNLRFRETPDLNGKFIRSLNQNEKLELIEKDKEETIDGKKGTWVKVKTEKGEVGWCFDAYLEEVKKK